MDAILRGAAVYFFLLLILRLGGKRSLAQITAFDFVLLLIISEATQQALLADDYSVTNGFLVIVTLVGIDIGLSIWKQRSPRTEKWIDDAPVVLIENGTILRERMERERVDLDDILTAARELHGLERLDQIKYAVLERSGGISIIPKPETVGA